MTLLGVHNGYMPTRMQAARTVLPPRLQPLLQAHRYPGDVKQVTLIETHISWVLLAGPQAFKFKKPLNLGFLDFSTLAQRKAACV